MLAGCAEAGGGAPLGVAPCPQAVTLSVRRAIETIDRNMASSVGSAQTLDVGGEIPHIFRCQPLRNGGHDLPIAACASGVALVAGAAGVIIELLYGVYRLLRAQGGVPGGGIAIASVVGAIVLAPPAIVEAGSRLFDPTILALGVAVGLLSSVIPYSFELIALRRIPPRVFSILMSLEPAAAAFAAMIVLGEFLSLLQWLAMACVVIASIGATRTSTTLDQPAPD